jgi:hypothetical protein
MKGGLITEHQPFPETVFLKLFLHAATNAVTSIVVSWFQLLKEVAVCKASCADAYA